MAQNEKSPKHAWGKHRYTSVVDGCTMAAQYRRSGLTIGEFVRQTGVSRRMVLYWTQRERELATAVEAGFTEVTASLPAPAPPIAAPVPPAVNSCQPDGPATPQQRQSHREHWLLNPAIPPLRSDFQAAQPSRSVGTSILKHSARS
jgi:hypothetical protein